MQLIIHRGAKEIGGSCVEIRADRTRILIDFGIPLVNKNKEPFNSNDLTQKSDRKINKPMVTASDFIKR